MELKAKSFDRGLFSQIVRTFMEENYRITELQQTVFAIANRGWCPATGGNFSVRLELESCAITASGIDKTTIQAADFLVVDFTGKVVSGTQKPSAETLLHTTLYSLDPDIGAVLHVHTLSDTVLSIHFSEYDALTFQGYEMQKALQGIIDHDSQVNLPILDNSQNMNLLSEALKQRWEPEVFYYGFLVRGHGLYAWGKNLVEAKRHLEGIEFLLHCELHRMLLSRK